MKKLVRPHRSGADCGKDYEPHCKNIARIIAAVYQTDLLQNMKASAAKEAVQVYMEMTDARCEDYECE